jgi:succinate-semialdehyde dehydrogenase/glutarate-semialdehyde dehydrogenase
MTATLNNTARRIVNPANGTLVDELPDSELAEVDEALERAVAGQRRWARVPRHERARLMRAYAELVRQHQDEIAVLLSTEQGKPLAQSEAELGLHYRLFDGFASRLLVQEERAFFLDNQPVIDRDLQITKHEPLGVIAGIVPFNFPIELYSHKVAPAIAAGNSIIVKPSEETPLATRRLVELVHEAGIPEDVVQIVYGGAEVGRRLAESPLVAAVSFTGSTEVGISVAQNGAKTLKRTLLELGGNDAMVVLDDANLDEVVQNAVFGRTLSNGQCCCANKRIVVHESVRDELTARLLDSFGASKMGDPLDATTALGPLITAKAAAKVEEQIKHTVSQGATLAAGGVRDNCFVEPTVLTEVDLSMDIARDMEVFGPVLAMMSFSTIDQAVEIANATKYGLSGSVFTQDMKKAMEVGTRLETGQVVVNGTGLYRSDVMGFGGYKSSGVGREGLAYSIEEFMQLKTLTFTGIMPGVVGA